MSDDNLERLENDLATVQQAMSLDNPYDAADIPAMLLIGVGALVALPLLALSPWPQRPTLILAMSPGLLLYMRRIAITRRNQAARPGLWKEYKYSAVAAVVVGLAAGGWIWWSQWFGTSRETAGAAIVFCIGVAGLVIATMDQSRRSYLMGSFCLIIFGMAIPWLEPRNIATVGAVVIAITCLSTAVFIWWQTHPQTFKLGGGESP